MIWAGKTENELAGICFCAIGKMKECASKATEEAEEKVNNTFLSLFFSSNQP